jgi:hypothetical protein
MRVYRKNWPNMAIGVTHHVMLSATLRPVQPAAAAELCDRGGPELSDMWNEERLPISAARPKPKAGPQN